MEEINEKHDHKHEHDGHCCHGYRRFWFLRLIVVVVGLLLAFSLGTAFGKFHQGWDGGRLGGNMMYGMRGYKVTDDFAASQISGTVNKVEGNKITITDNAGKVQTVMTSGSTVIVLNGEEIGLGALKAGQFLRATGARGQNAEFTARAIRVSAQ